MITGLLTRLAVILTAGTDFIEDLWDGLTTMIAKVISFFSTLFSSIVSLFWTSGTDGGLTTIGWLMLISLAVGMFWLAFRFIRGLVKGMGRRG